MKWLFEMSIAQPVAWAVLVLMIVAVAGLAISTIKIKGIGIGVVGVLFAGIMAGHFGLHIEPGTLEFVREFGLILFVFTIGLQLGPGFFDSFRKQGLRLNLMAMAVVLLGAVLTVAAVFFVDTAAALGLFSGATTNTPSLGATQQMLKTLGGKLADKTAMPAIAYAVAYPGGVFGIIAVLLFLRKAFGIDAEKEAEQFRVEQKGDVEPLRRVNLMVENERLENRLLGEVLGEDEGLVISRIRRADTGLVETATEQTVLHQKDVILAVGTARALERVQVLVGSRTDMDLTQAPGRVISARMIVTEKKSSVEPSNP